jgi:hypothetical protein
MILETISSLLVFFLTIVTWCLLVTGALGVRFLWIVEDGTIES